MGAKKHILFAMKRRSLLSLFAPVTALFVASAFTACDKAPEKTTAPQPEPAKPATEKAAEAPKPAHAQTTPTIPAPAQPSAEAAKPATQTADIAKIASTYGFVARIPKDAESFSAIYHLHDIWLSLSKSKWATTLLDLEPVKQDPQFQNFLKQWSSPEAQKAKDLLEAIFGNEFLAVQPAGFSEKVLPLQEAISKFSEAYVQQAFLAGLSGKQMGPKEIQSLLQNAAPELVPALAKCDVPPLLFVSKAGKAKADIDGAFKQLTEMVGTKLPPAFELGSFKVADKYEFKTLSVVAKKLVAQFQEVQFELQLKELIGDEAKAKELVAQISAKHAELAWGWVDDYFVVSLGKDHSHVKFALLEADSALAIPDVAKRAVQFAEKKPMGLAYVSKALFEKFSPQVEFAAKFNGISNELRGILKPEHITAMQADVKKLEGKAQSLFKRQFDPMVSVSYVDSGIHADSFGGLRNSSYDSSKPLGFASLASPASFLFFDSRANGPHSKAVVDFVEEGAITLWGWYEKYGRTMIPEEERKNAVAAEGMAKPMVEQLWKSTRLLGSALGDESSFILDLNGNVPKLPDIPPFLADGKIPRIAYIAELKDRAALAESWKGFASLIKQIPAFVPPTALPQGVPEPVMKKDGDVELHFIPLPMPTDDVLPHIAISKDRWVISTSPSFSKELTSKAAATTGHAMGSNDQVNFSAVWDLAEVWLGVLDKNAEQMLGPGEAKGFKENRPLISTALKLARCFKGMESQISEESGQARMSVHLKVEDLK